MRLRVNGEEYITEKRTLAELLTELNIMFERVAVEVNLRVTRRAEFPTLELQEGDSIEIVNFVGGGAQD